MNKDKYILGVKKFNDNFIVVYDNNGLFDCDPSLVFYNNDNSIILEHKIKTVRIFLDVVMFPERNILGYIYCEYEDDVNKIFFVFYKFKDNKLEFYKKYNVLTTCSCNNLMFKISNPIDNIYTLVWGDLCNYDYCNFIYFNEGGIDNQKKITNVDNIEDYYYFSDTMIIEKDLIVHDNNMISIGLKFLDEEKYFCVIKNVEMPFLEIKDSECEILMMKTTFCLIKLKLFVKKDILHIEEYFIDILINYKENKILDLSEKYKDEYLLSYVEDNKIIHKLIKSS